MRTTNTLEYNETRDAVAHEWARFLELVFSCPCWVPVPNQLSDIKTFCNFWHLNGIILSGGNEEKIRDKTEFGLIDFALKEDLPLIGVCHGFQSLNRFFGGGLHEDSTGAHAGNRHCVTVMPPYSHSKKNLKLNSYHENIIDQKELAGELEIMALSSDGFVEGAVSRTGRLAGIMWHPEREEQYSDFDVKFFRRWFGFGELGA